MRALDQVDAMKSKVPLLGELHALDYSTVEQARLSDDASNIQDVTRELVSTLNGLPIWGHPQTQINVVPPSTIPSIIGALLPAIYNPNMVSDDSSHCGFDAEDNDPQVGVVAEFTFHSVHNRFDLARPHQNSRKPVRFVKRLIPDAQRPMIGQQFGHATNDIRWQNNFNQPQFHAHSR